MSNEVLPVMREMITDSIFPEEELEIYKQNSKQKLSVNLQKCDFVANRLIDAYLYGEQHPYGKYLVAADYDALTTEQLKDFFQAILYQWQCVIFVAGNLPDGLFEQMNKHFGDLPLTTNLADRARKHTIACIQKKYRVCQRSQWCAGCHPDRKAFPNRHHPDFMRVMVLNTVFGGFFGSRLMSNIREDKGYTYGIHSYVQNHMQIAPG